MKRILLISALLLAVIFTVSADRRRLLGARDVAGAGASSPTPDILWWKLNEGSGTTIAGDGSNGGDDATTSASWTTGASGAGSSLSFNGSSGYATNNTTLTYSTNRIMITWWMKPDAASSRMVFESSVNLNSVDNTFYCYKGTAAAVEFTAKTGGSRTETFPVTTNAWNHYAAVWDGSVLAGDWSLFMDGAEVLASATNVTTRSSTAGFDARALYVGARGGTSIYYLGLIDDLRIYSGTNYHDIAAIYANPQ